MEARIPPGVDATDPGGDRKLPALKPVLRAWWTTYCESTTIHGFKYLATPNRPLYERIYWAVAILGVLSAVWFIISDQLEQFTRSSVVFSLESEPTPIFSIPFPAVTFCPEPQVRPSMLLRPSAETEEIKNERLDYLLWLCPSKNSGGKPKYIYNSTSVQAILEEINGEEACRGTVVEIRWQSEKLTDPCKYVQPIATEAGACLTFNMLSLSQIFRQHDAIVRTSGRVEEEAGEKAWNPEEGYTVQRDPNCSTCFPPPWNTWGNGNGHGLTVYLDFRANDYDEECGSGSKGFFVYVHNPSEVPGDSHSVSYLDLNHINIVQVRPKVYTVDDRLRHWKPRQRGCYYQQERRLLHFRVYTQRNCDLECEANTTLQQCGCVSRHHPRLRDTPVCGLGHQTCVLNSFSDTTENNTCRCLPSCSELEYEITTAQFQRYWSQRPPFITIKPEKNSSSYATLQVMFLNRYTIATRRNVMFGASDLIANMGGLLGLFLGFSLLSLFELVYFIFLEPLRCLSRMIAHRHE